ncbi:hypothetical protein HPB50_001482 [Hyalomma asiaticum]|uniref:Uncharacterized protein n=1 Tax=Hyalomma asiaticum TaxID=266040 RepID=A0ACB7RRU1_HYAAI|nr:hypothetical protein HPB50_001482 [Hyalomma asiaticum]
MPSFVDGVTQASHAYMTVVPASERGWSDCAPDYRVFPSIHEPCGSAQIAVTTDPVQVHHPEPFPLPQVNMQSEGRLVATPSGEKGVLTLGAEKGLSKSGLTVSIVVEPVDPSAAACVDDDPYTCKTPTPAEEDMVRSLIMNAELRKEEFAKLLEEHAQIVMEINKAENSLA